MLRILEGSSIGVIDARAVAFKPSSREPALEWVHANGDARPLPAIDLKVVAGVLGDLGDGTPPSPWTVGLNMSSCLFRQPRCTRGRGHDLQSRDGLGQIHLQVSLELAADLPRIAAVRCRDRPILGLFANLPHVS